MKILDRIANLAITLVVAVFLTLIVLGEFFRRAPASAKSPSSPPRPIPSPPTPT